MSETARPPSPDGVPILGNGMAFSRDPFAAMREWAKQGPVVRLDFPGRSQYLVTDPELVRQVLVEGQDVFTIGQRQRETFRGIEDNAITASTGGQWARRRKALQPAFTWEGIRDYGDRMAERASDHTSRWDDGDTIDLLAEMRLLTVRILGDTLLGIDMEGREAVVLEAADALVAWADFRRFGHLLPDWVPTPTQRRFDRAIARLDRYIDDVLEDHPRGDSDVASVLLEAYEDGELSWDEVRDNTAGLMLGGHDSTAVAFTYAWYELSRHPGVRTDVVAEVETVVGDGLPSASDFDALELTRRVVDETLRLYPPTWAVSRESTEPVTLGEYDLPAGAQLVLPLWVLHRDERFWDAPAQFDPSRWSADTDRPEYAYFPFSGGPRHCIGMRFALLELVLGLATMVGRVSMDVAVEGPLSFTPSLSLRPEPDITATVHRNAD